MYKRKIYLRNIKKKLQNFKSYVFFGAGGGASVAYYLLKNEISDNVLFCDNNKEKQEGQFWGKQVYSVEDAINLFPHACYIISFRNNQSENNKIAGEQLESLGVNVSDQVVYFDGNIIGQEKSINYSVKNLAYRMYLKHLKKSSNKKSNKEIDAIRTITLGKYKPQGGVGGYSAGVSCQKCLLGDKYKHIDLLYSFYGENRFDLEFGNPYAWFFKHVQYVIDEVKKDSERNVIYIAHDYLTAYALSILNREYLLIYHHQGSVMDERGFFDIHDTEKQKKMIMYAENEAFECAKSIHFPSDGAAAAFFSSDNKIVNSQNQSKKGINLPVTKWAKANESFVFNEVLISKDEITILSIGQMSYAKGLDQVPDFIERLLAAYGQTIHWIVVAWGGELKKIVLGKCNELCKRDRRFRYTHFEHCTYDEIQYLHRHTDIYLMLHRISIFDISTLEAMSYGKMVLLSPVGGNIEYNIRNNIIFYDSKTEIDKIDISLDNRRLIGARNRQIYENNFSPSIYKRRYYELFDELLRSENTC